DFLRRQDPKMPTNRLVAGILGITVGGGPSAVGTCPERDPSALLDSIGSFAIDKLFFPERPPGRALATFIPNPSFAQRETGQFAIHGLLQVSKQIKKLIITTVVETSAINITRAQFHLYINTSCR